MTDYKKYINALRKCAKEHENDRTFTGHIIVSDLCQDTANLLEELEQEPRWIPVSERLPKANEFEDKVRKYYLVQTDFGDMLVAYYDGYHWVQIYTHNYIKVRIVAWMPLPKAYREVEE